MNLPIPYPDREQVVLDILSPLEAQGVTSLPPDWEPPLYQVKRIGGGPDPWDVTDYALVRVSYYGSTRNKAWNLSQQGESLIIGHHQRTIDRLGALSNGMLVDYAGLEVGGSENPDLDPDDRRVDVNYTIGMRRQHHLVVT